jgi:hypothetical protein
MLRKQWPLILVLLILVAAIAMRLTGVGATAKCRDGTYSWSRHHSGTCSGHHGVAEWYR